MSYTQELEMLVLPAKAILSSTYVRFDDALTVNSEIFHHYKLIWQHLA